MNIRSRWFLLFAGLMSATLVMAAACSSGTSSGDKTKTAAAGGGKTPAAGATTSAAGEQAPADQQHIVGALPAEPEFYDPQRSNFEQDIGVERMMFRALYDLVDDGSGGVKVVADMAAGDPQVTANIDAAGKLASPNEAATTYTIKIASGKKWSDGVPVKAGDFAYAIQRACDPDVADPYQYILGAGLLQVQGCDELTANKDATQKAALLAAVGVSAPDDSTLVLKSGRVVPNVKTLLSLWVTFPARKDIIEKFGDKWTDPANIVTNGPFTLKEVVAKDHATFIPNPQWSGKKPVLQEITLKFIDDLTVAFRGFQTGEIMSTQINATDVKTAKADSSLKDALIVTLSARITAVEVHMKDPVLGAEGAKGYNVRLALARAVDRKALVDAVYDNVYVPATYWVAKGIEGHQEDTKYDSQIGFDKAAAQKALSDAGYPNGQGFPTVGILLTDSAINRNLADFLVKQWKDNLGITVTPEFVDGKTRSKRNNAHDFQLFPGGWQSDYPDAENFISGQFNTGGGNNQWECSDPDIDAAATAAGAATDNETRLKNYQKVEDLVIQKLCGVLPIYQNGRPWLVSTKLGGVTPNGVLDAGMAGNWCVECWFVKK